MGVPTLAVAAAVLAFLLVTAWWFPRAPVPLLGMLLASTAVAVFDLRDRGIDVIGTIPAGCRRPRSRRWG